MKHIIYIVIILILSFLLILKTCEEPEVVFDDTVIKEYEAEREAHLDSIVVLNEVIDSLLHIPPEIQRIVEYRQADIDSVISVDSSQALVVFRDYLDSLGTKPDSGEVTNRELGHSAKYFAELQGRRAEIPILNEIINNQDEVIIGLYEVIELDSLILRETKANYEKIIEDVTPSFFEKVPVVATITAIIVTGINYLLNK